MKIRNGFVSNSSSASFIIKFTTSLSRNEIENIIMESNKHSLKNEEENAFHKRGNFKDSLKKKKDEYHFYVETCMFNDWNDIVYWPFVRAISEKRIKDINLVEIRQTEEEYRSCDCSVEYSEEPWNFQWEDQKDDVEKVMIENDIEYFDYLKKIMQIDDEEYKIIKTQRLLSK